MNVKLKKWCITHSSNECVCLRKLSRDELVENLRWRFYSFPRVWEGWLSGADGDHLIQHGEQNCLLCKRIRARIRARGKDPITAEVVRQGGISIL